MLVVLSFMLTKLLANKVMKDGHMPFQRGEDSLSSFITSFAKDFVNMTTQTFPSYASVSMMCALLV
jgi:hypothetical protein